MDLFSTPSGFRLFQAHQPTFSEGSPFATPIPTRIVDLEEETFPRSYSPEILASIGSQSSISENILPGLFAHSECSISEKKDRVLLKVGPFMLESYEGENADRIRQIIGPCNTGSFLQFTAFISFLASNNILEDINEQEAFLEWIGRQNQLFLQSMFAIKMPALRAFLETLLNYTVATHNTATFELLFRVDKSKEWYHGRREVLLLAAVQFDLVDIVRILCEEGTDVNYRYRTSSISWVVGSSSTLGAATTKGMTQLLLGLGADFDLQGVSRHKLASRAIERGELGLAEILLEAGAVLDLNHYSTELNNGTPLAQAISDNDMRTVKFLLKHRATCSDGPLCYRYRNARFGWDFATELQLAAFLGYEEIVLALLYTSSGRASLSTGRYRWAPLRDASMVGNVEIVKHLIAFGADVNASNEISPDNFNTKDLEPSTPLIAAIEGGHTEVVKVLLREDVNVGGADFSKHGTSALEAAENLGHHDIVLLLLQAGAVRHPLRERVHQIVELFFAARSNNLERVRRLIAGGVHIGYIIDAAISIWEPTCYLQEYNAKCSDMVSIFLKVCGNQIDAQGPLSQRTALQFAMQRNLSTVAQQLISAGANLDTGHVYGNPLKWAIRKRDYAMIELLVSRGVTTVSLLSDFDLYDVFKSDHDLSFIIFLVDKGINIPLAEWCTRALNRLGHNNLPIDSIRVLIEQGADVNPAVYDRRTPLQKVIEENSPISIIRLLIDKGADINASPAVCHGRTALQAAILPCKDRLELIPNMDTVDLLLEMGADINAPPAKLGGATALQGAAIRGYLKIAHMLLERGAEPNAAGSLEGRTALEGAAEQGRLDMVQLLLNAGAHAEENAARYAEKYNHFVIADLIRDNMEYHEHEVNWAFFGFAPNLVSGI